MTQDDLVLLAIGLGFSTSVRISGALKISTKSASAACSVLYKRGLIEPNPDVTPEVWCRERCYQWRAVNAKAKFGLCYPAPMLNAYPGKKLRNLRKRANLTQMQVVELTGVSETTIHYLEHDLRKPQTKTLETLLNLYAIHILRIEKRERIWGDDGLQGESQCKVKSLSPSPSVAQNASKPAYTR